MENRKIRIRTEDGSETVLLSHSSAFKSCDYAFNHSAWDVRNGKVGNTLAVARTTKAAPGVVDLVRQEPMRRKENIVVFADSLKRLNTLLERSRSMRR